MRGDKIHTLATAKRKAGWKVPGLTENRYGTALDGRLG